MQIPNTLLSQLAHREMVEELLDLTTAEDRLSFLMERQPTHPLLEAHERTETRKVPGCLSGLWLAADCQDNQMMFRAYSDSDLVGGMASYVCDLYGKRSPSEVVQIGSSLADLLRLDGLLSTTRKRALSATLAFILHSARCACLQPPTIATSTPSHVATATAL
jgi:cysteine desulfuration protein SufE